MKKILVIGGGAYQVPLIRRIQELGYESYCVDRNAKSEGFLYASGYKTCDVIDKEACLAYAKDLEISAVMTYGATLTLPTVAYIGQKLGLPALPVETAEIAKNKFHIKQRLIQSGCNCYGKCFKIVRGDNLDPDEISFPCVIKPCDGSGSKGVSIVNNQTELSEALKYAFSSARYGEIYYEDFVDGSEYSVEAFVNNSKPYIYGIVKTTFKQTGEDNESIEYGHRVPAGLSENIEKAIANEVKKAIKALNITMFSVNFDVIVSKTDKKVYIIDCGIRVGQNLLASHLIPLSCGVNIMDQTINLALGNSIDAKPGCRKYIASRLLIYNPGTIINIKDTKELLNKNGVVDVVLRKKRGEQQKIFKEKSDTCGWVICEGTSPDEAEANASMARKSLRAYFEIR